MSNHDKDLYALLKEALDQATQPMTCVELLNVPEVREAAIERFGSNMQVTTNKISDMLGFMWRRMLIARYDAPLSNMSKARFAYGRVERKVAEQSTDPLSPPVPLHGKPSFAISEKDGDVIIDFPRFTVIVRPK